MDLENSVILPREDFLELQAVAWNQPPATRKERAESVTQSTLIFAGIAAAWAAGTWGWVTAMEWKAKRDFERSLIDPTTGQKYQPL